MSLTKKALQVFSSVIATALFVVLALSVLAVPVSAASSFTQYSYGGLTYKLYVPSGYKAGTAVPMVVMLHGCTQDADQFAAGTQMNVLAEQENFLVLYPQQSSSRNQNKCWNFFETANQSRGSGEPAIIMGMIDEVKAKYSVDNGAVFVTGLSAGGGMTSIMGATYPDVFAAFSVSAGLEYKAATSMTNAFTAMNSGGLDPVTCGLDAYKAMGKYARVMPTMIFHGSSDSTVVPKNSEQLVTQWLTTNDYADDGAKNSSISAKTLVTSSGQVTGGRAYSIDTYKDNNGNVVVQRYLVTGMGHAWSGGSTAGSYTDPKGPNQTQITWDFFKAAAGYTGGGGGGVDPEPTPGPTPGPGEEEEKPVPPANYQTITATATEHYVAGRLNVTQYNAMGLKYGYSKPFALYLLDGSTTWTDVNPAPVDPTPVDPTPVDPEDPTPVEPEPKPVQYETVMGTASEHLVAKRINNDQYLAYGAKYGYIKQFALYRVAGSDVWTDVTPA